MNEKTGAMPQAPKSFIKSPLFVIFVTIFIDLVGFGIMIPVLPYYVTSPEFSASPFEIGMLFAAYSVMQFIFSPILGGLSDKYGRRPVLFFSLLGTSLAALITGLAGALWIVFLGRILDGITGGNISTAQAYIADVTTKENRARGMGLVGAAFGLGFIFGPAIGGVLSKFGSGVPFFFVSALALANAITLYFVLPESRKFGEKNTGETRRSHFANLLETFQDSRFAVITLIYFLVIVAFSIMTTSFAQYTMFRFGYNAEQNGYLFAFVGILAVILQGGIFARLVKVFGESALVVAGCMFLTVSLFAVPFVGPATGGLAALLVGIAFFSVGNSLSSPALTSLASIEAREEQQGKTLGMMQSAASLARAVGPALAAVLLYSATAPGNISDHTLFRTFWAAAAIMFVTLILSVYFASMKRKEVLV